MFEGENLTSGGETVDYRAKQGGNVVKTRDKRAVIKQSMLISGVKKGEGKAG